MNIGENFYCSKCMRKTTEETICPCCGHNPDSPANRNALEEGTLLQKGRYQLGAVLGTGGFGITYAAWDHILSQPVAVKEYFPQSLVSRDIQESDQVLIMEEHRAAYEVGLYRFNREAKILSTLQNVRNVVTVHDWFETNSTAYIVMEFVRGKTLEQYVKDEKLPPAKLIDMSKDLIDSLISVHAQGVLHRDISPGNLMVQEDGTIKLIDFGAAVTEERRAQGKDHTVIFSRAFAPIEQYDENGCQGPWTDVYALSATFYYLITNELPLEAMARKGSDSLKSLRSRQIHLKKYQEKAILDGMIVQPQKRIQSMEIFRSVLYHLPMPEEIRLRRQFMVKVLSASAGIAAAGILFAGNALWGFPGVSGIRFGIRSDGLHIVGSYSHQDVLTIPSSILGIPVTEIETGAFDRNQNLTEVTIPGSVKHIHPRAFSGCESLLSVTIEEGNQSIDEYAFSDCSSLQTVILPSSTGYVAASAFSGTSDSLTVWCEDESTPQITMIGSGIHTASLSDYETVPNDTGVTVTDYHGTISQYESADSLVISDYIGNQPVTAFEPVRETNLFPEDLISIELPEHLEILPSGVVSGLSSLEEVRLGTKLKEIGPNAFLGTGIKEITLPDTLETIGEEAFSMSTLEQITLPDSVTSVGENAFFCCIQLSSVTLPNHLEMIPNGMFNGCIKLTDITLPENLTSIGVFAFINCSSLRSLVLPSTLETIEAYAFSECENLQVIYIPPQTDSIAIKAFDGCPSSMMIAGISGTTAQHYADKFGFPFMAVEQWDYDMYTVSERGGLIIQEGAKEEEETELPFVLVGIGKECYIVDRLVNAQFLKSRRVILPRYATVAATDAFLNNDFLTEVRSNKNLQTIGSRTFSKCKNLQTFHFMEGLLEIGNLAFAEDEKLTDIHLPDSLESIGYNAFQGCRNLTSINIPSALTLLGDGCFSNTGITTVTVPGNIVKCRTSFYGCENLQTAVMEEGVRTVWGTFSQCPALESVIFPSTVQEISRSTFHGCTSLKDVWIYSENANLDFVWRGLKHIDDVEGDNGAIQASTVILETDSDSTPLLFADCPNVTIHGYSGSTAETYAKEHGISFQAIE